ncbi:MAG: hypothetical protein IT535_14895 [Bauldia sp.]|nr:hypothetical protein [Bauldia sp.]
MVRSPDLGLLQDAGFSLYERRALASLMALGVADAAALCRKGDIPTSKIYLAMEKLERLGLCEVQPTRPKLFSALGAAIVVERLVGLARERADAFAAQAEDLRGALGALAGGLGSRQPVVDLALGQESHIKRHLTRLADARESVLSYMESGDLAAIEAQAAAGFDVLKRITRARGERAVDHRAVFGFSNRTAPALLDFLWPSRPLAQRAHRPPLFGRARPPLPRHRRGDRHPLARQPVRARRALRLAPGAGRRARREPRGGLRHPLETRAGRPLRDPLLSAPELTGGRPDGGAARRMHGFRALARPC